MSSTVRTAGQIADEQAHAPEPTQVRRTVSYGVPDGNQALVNTAQLSSMLRASHPSGADIEHRAGWWTLRLPRLGVYAEGPDFGVLAAAAVPRLRTWAAQDASGASGDPLVWLVHTSSDEDLRAWLHIPCPKTPEGPGASL